MECTIDWSQFGRGIGLWFLLTIGASLVMSGLNLCDNWINGRTIRFDDYCSDILTLSVVAVLTLAKDYISLLKAGNAPDVLMVILAVVGVGSLLVCCNAYSNLNHKMTVSVVLPSDRTNNTLEHTDHIIISFSEKKNRFKSFSEEFTQPDNDIFKLLKLGKIRQDRANKIAIITLLINIVLEIVVQLFLSIQAG